MNEYSTMTDTSTARKEVLDEIINRGKLGNKKFHSETSLQQFGEDEAGDITSADPGVQNESVGNGYVSSDQPERRRTMSQPGPVSGNLVTATAARANRKRTPRNVMYSPDIDKTDLSSDKTPKLTLSIRGEDSGSATPTGDRNSPFLYGSNFKNGDARSFNSYRLYTPASDIRGSSTPRKRSEVTMDAQSLRSIETHAPPPTSPEDNKKQTRRYMILILSAIYAILLVTLGLIIHIGDTIVDYPVSEIYSIALCSLGFIYIIYLIIDINRYKSIATKNHKIKAQHEEKLREYFLKQEEASGIITPGDRTPDSYRHGLPAPVLIPVKHEYCFSQGRHSGSFYLKLGAAGFALGHLVHSVLLIAVQISFIADENIDNNECINVLQVVADIMIPIYCFLQLYFIFKYSNVIILKAQGLALIAFMHLIGTSLCFWIAAIVRETILGLTLYANSVYGNEDYASSNDNFTLSEVSESNVGQRLFDVSGLYNPNCIGSPTINSIYEDFSPYLYPFSVEFNILIVAVYYIIWSNIGNCDNDDGNSDANSSIDDNYRMCRIPTANEDNDFTSNIVIYADCHASNRGLFLGLMVTVIIAGMLIIGFVFSSGTFAEIGYLLNSATNLGLHLIMLFAAILAFNQLRQLDINEHPISLLDDVLLFICLPAFFMETVFSLIATINILNIVRTIDFCVMVIQVIVQTPLIMDGLRRCSNSKKLRRKKPGREVLMFLLIANVAMWLFYTFSYKSPESLDERYTFYGKVAWTILGHVSLPLIMFFRFHSSVCFADIWNSAYQPGSEH